LVRSDTIGKTAEAVEVVCTKVRREDTGGVNGVNRDAGEPWKGIKSYTCAMNDIVRTSRNGHQNVVATESCGHCAKISYLAEVVDAENVVISFGHLRCKKHANSQAECREKLPCCCGHDEICVFHI